MRYEYLGYAGAAPFVASASAILFGVHQINAASALLYYSVIILSFLGGVQWGAALIALDQGSHFRFTFSIVPSLAAWAALLLPVRAAFAYLAICFLMFWLAERYLYKISPRYQRLRNILTAIVVTSLTAAFGSFP